MRGVVGEGDGPQGRPQAEGAGDAGRPATLRPWVPAHPASVGVAHPAPPEPPTLHLETEGAAKLEPGPGNRPRLYEGVVGEGRTGPRDGHRREGAGDAGRPATLRPWVPAYPASVGVAYPAPLEPPTLHLETEGGGEVRFVAGGEHPRPEPHTLAGTSDELDRPGQSWSLAETAPDSGGGEWSGRAGRAPRDGHRREVGDAGRPATLRPWVPAYPASVGVAYPAPPEPPTLHLETEGGRRSVGGAAPGPVATIRPRASGALARGGREWAVPPRTPKVGTLWAVGGSPHHRPEIHQGNCATLTPQGGASRGVPYWGSQARGLCPGAGPWVNARGEPDATWAWPRGGAPGARRSRSPPAAEPSAAAPVQ
ncbi:hypothetical protein GQ602_007406 [Ophiocordyceps camponoti-floridani]|uniref:Uncharacterized protein n=1 Tax=Ophiocordyceps camponoti-floridani TaxID=2030778 RepID=A0A8H4Q0D3_9HYPO|nr:hypothetical protein GQ602_007406 [Ophiocordyceps camponoti-floridani]